MVKIKIKNGRWNNEGFDRVLLWQSCPNPKCKAGELHMPDYMKDAYCPDCRADLIAPVLNEGTGKRIAYHLEA